MNYFRYFLLYFMITLSYYAQIAEGPLQAKSLTVGDKFSNLGINHEKIDNSRDNVNNANNPSDANKGIPVDSELRKVNPNPVQSNGQLPRLNNLKPNKPENSNADFRPFSQPLGDRLSDRLECTDDVNKYCSKVPKQSDIAILQCLQDAGDGDEALTAGCQHLLWEFKVNLTQDDRFRKAAEEFCRDELAMHTECKNEASERGHLISCLSDAKEQMTNGQCKSFLNRVESIIFTDFRLVGRFVSACKNDVRKFNCGQLEDDSSQKNAASIVRDPVQQPNNINNKALHSQGATLECLLRNLIENGKGDQQLDAVCRHEIIRIAELQADDFHLDRPLFFACRQDRERFCHDINAGEGRIFQCLTEHRLDRDMSRQCQQTLEMRLKVVAANFRLSKPLVKACRKEMHDFNCDFRPTDPSSVQPPEHMFLAYVLLCLEDAARKGSTLQRECQAQLFEHRRLLMSDYRMDPQIVLACSGDIQKFCGDKLEDGGRTLHCLMNVARMRNRDMQPACLQAVTRTIQAANVGSDYRVDRVLYADCKKLIDSVCHTIATSESDVLSCLMTNVESPLMTEDCENRLLEVQYFLSRDFKLDSQLFEACKTDAASKCGGDKGWIEKQQLEQAVGAAPPPVGQAANINMAQPERKAEQGAERGYLILTCLYRHAYDDDSENRLQPKCAKEVRRVMRERSITVKLLPQIEDECLNDLAAKCSQRTAPGEEMRCLQENLNELSENCKKRVQEYSVQESVDSRLDHTLMRACGPVLEQHCKDIIDKDVDQGDVMECLLKNKGVQAMSSKCRTYVNHHELMSLKDYRFSYKFRQSCKTDIESFCVQTGTATDKASIVRCLSEIVVAHALLNGNDQISKECRKQLRAEFFNVEAVGVQSGDPKLFEACKSDLAAKCNAADSGIQAMECLREHKQDLDTKCRKYIFKKEKLEFQDNTFDSMLNRVCADEIRTLCAQSPAERVLHCLKAKIRRIGAQVSVDCLQLVNKRQREQATDIRLQPALLKACETDMRHFCQKELQQIDDFKSAVEAEGVVVNCLRKSSTAKQNGVILSAGCQLEVRRIIFESEVDPNLDPVFYRNCKEEIMSKCNDALILKEGHQSLLECIKYNYKRNTILNKKCKEEIARKINEELADIQLDPELNTACTTDLQHYCADVKPGDGKLLQCLLDASRSTNARLSQACHAKLLDREALWKHVKDENQPINLPNNVGGIVNAIYISPVRNTVATALLIIIAVIFIVGLCCGRVTKRLRRELKNR